MVGLSALPSNLPFLLPPFLNEWQVLGEKLGIPAVVTAMMGLSTLLLTGVLTWKDCLVYSSAWDTLFWFASELLRVTTFSSLPVCERLRAVD